MLGQPSKGKNELVIIPSLCAILQWCMDPIGLAGGMAELMATFTVTVTKCEDGDDVKRLWFDKGRLLKQLHCDPIYIYIMFIRSQLHCIVRAVWATWGETGMMCSSAEHIEWWEANGKNMEPCRLCQLLKGMWCASSVCERTTAFPYILYVG